MISFVQLRTRSTSLTTLVARIQSVPMQSTSVLTPAPATERCYKVRS